MASQVGLNAVPAAELRQSLTVPNDFLCSFEPDGGQVGASSTTRLREPLINPLSFIIVVYSATHYVGTRVVGRHRVEKP